MIRLVFDTETTGLPLPEAADLSKQPKIIEIGAVKLDGDKVIERYSQLINPGEFLEEKITKITGIKDEDLVGKPSFGDVLPKVREIFTDCDELIAHNAPFDTALLRFDLRRCNVEDFIWPRKITCTVQEFMYLKGRKLKLIDLYELILKKPLAQTHRALDDVDALIEILMHVGYFSNDTVENPF